MKTTTLKTLVATLLAVVLCACGTTYTFNNERYRSSEEALAAQRTYLDGMLAELKVRNPPVAPKALVITPSKSTIEALGLRRTGTPKEEVIAYLTEFSQQDHQLFFQALQKSRLFNIVESRLSDFPLREARKEQGSFDAVVYFHLASPTQHAWYVLRKGDDNPRLIVVDPLTKGTPRIESWIDGVEAAYNKR